MAVHRVVAADRQRGDIGVTALPYQFHVAEGAGVAGVVDGRLAELDQEARRRSYRNAVLGTEGILFRAGDRVGVPGGDEGDVAPVELDGTAEIGVADLLDALPFEPLGQLDDRDAVGAGPLRHRDRVGNVVGMPVADRDVGRIDPSAVATAIGLFGFRNGSTSTVVAPSLSSKHD